MATSPLSRTRRGQGQRSRSLCGGGAGAGPKEAAHTPRRPQDRGPPLNTRSPQTKIIIIIVSIIKSTQSWQRMASAAVAYMHKTAMAKAK
eukprot:scaffold325377_cov31-Prasinocladus_malaysianus.AAC.2